MSFIEELNPPAGNFRGTKKPSSRLSSRADLALQGCALLPRRNWNFREATQKEITVMETNSLTLGLPKGEDILEQPQKRVEVHE